MGMIMNSFIMTEDSGIQNLNPIQRARKPCLVTTLNLLFGKRLWEKWTVVILRQLEHRGQLKEGRFLCAVLRATAFSLLLYDYKWRTLKRKKKVNPVTRDTVLTHIWKLIYVTFQVFIESLTVHNFNTMDKCEFESKAEKINRFYIRSSSQHSRNFQQYGLLLHELLSEDGQTRSRIRPSGMACAMPGSQLTHENMRAERT